MGSTADEGLADRFSITGTGVDLTPEQSALMELAEELGLGFARRAARYDQEAGFPFENFDAMREAGLLKLCVPSQYGGLGADLFTYALVSAILGKHCGSTALTFNMHACSALWPGLLADALDMTAAQRVEHEKHRGLHFRRIVEEGAVYAQPSSEGTAAAAGKAPFGTTATKVDGGWILNGKKIFASLSGAADYYGVLCTEAKPGSEAPSMRDSLYIAVPKDAPGFSIVGDWDPMGMRGTVSRTLLLNDVFVADSGQMLPRGIYYQAANRWPHMFSTLAPTFMGISVAAYLFSVRYLRGEIDGMDPPARRRMHHTKQIGTAQMHILLEQSRSIFLRSFSEARIDPPKEMRLRAYAAHYTIMENASEISRLAIRTCGGQAIVKSWPLERLYRDSCCGSLMLPWTAELCLERIGREALYEAGEADD